MLSRSNRPRYATDDGTDGLHCGCCLLELAIELPILIPIALIAGLVYWLGSLTVGAMLRRRAEQPARRKGPTRAGRR